MTEARSPSGRQLPVLALDVVDDRRAGPAQQRRDNEPDALPAAGRGKSHDMLGAVVAQIAAVLAADKDTRLARQASPIDLAVDRPARRTIGRDRKRGGEGTRESVRVAIGGRRIIKKK